MLQTETVSCPICHSNDYRKWGEENGYSAVKCGDCGAVYVRNRPTLGSISAAARDGMHQTEKGQLDQRLGRQGWKVPFYASVIKRFFGGETGLTWLDVGTGNGEFVEAIVKALPDAKPLGIDPMEVKVATARSRGLPVEAKTLEDVTGRFDVVSLINVFSHIPDFPGFAEQAKARLKPGGSIFLETGNGGDLEKREDYPGDLLLPDHLVFAGVGQMTSLLESLGFSSVEHFSRRIDHPLWAAKQTLKSLLKGKPKIAVPYARPFRTVFYRARIA